MPDAQFPKSPMFVSGLELWQWVKQAKAMAIASDIPNSELSFLLQELAGLDKLALRLESFKDLPKIELKLPLSELAQLWERRLQERVPVQYLTGVAHWRNFSLQVTPAVLIPRPETELLIDLAVEAVKSRLQAENSNRKSTPPNPPGLFHSHENLDFVGVVDGACLPPLPTIECAFGTRRAGTGAPPLQENETALPNPPLVRGGEDFKSNPPEVREGEFSKSHWVDLGTGSGAIAIGLASELKNATIHAVDCSAAALAVARLNAENLGFESRVNFYQGLWWEPLEFLKGQVSGMVSNPPYIPSSTVLTLQPEVLKHEPHLALDGGFDGLDCIRHLVETAPDYLESGGVWLVEMMAGQAEAVAALLQSHGSYCDVRIFADLAGIDRFVLAYRL